MLSPETTRDLALINPYIQKMDHPRIESDLQRLLDQMHGKYTVVDLGCGNGHFLQEYLLQHPDAVGLGVERRYKRAYLSAQKMETAGVSTSRIAQMEIQEFFDHSPKGFWDEVWFQFPDPWPKARHEKNRMVNAEVFRQIYESLKPGGRFCFRSDCRSYWELLQAANIQFSLFPILRSQKGDLFFDAPTTLFQRKFMSLSTPIYSLEFRK